MRKVRTMVAVIGMAALTACGGAQEPAADETASQPAEIIADAGAPPPAFAQCVSCHAVKPGVNGVGPSLHGVVGRKAGTLPGYAYSEALKTWGKTLDEAELDKWLTAPMTDVPGTKMVFPGIPDPARRKAVIDYLVTLK